MTETMNKVYQDAQAACGLKVGDYVKVVHKFEYGEGGVDYGWILEMDKTIGRIGIIQGVGLTSLLVGFTELDASWKYPYFALEKTEKPEREFRPFEKVLVRENDAMRWRASLFSHRLDNGKYAMIIADWNQCIPYEGNEHLLGTTKTPEE